MDEENDYKHELKGFSFIWGKRIFHIGRYIYGYWFDRCTLNNQFTDRTGWGIKIDIAFGNIVRPIPMFWKKGFYTRKPSIQDVMDRGDFIEYFGEKLAEEILQIKESDRYHSAHNPWLAKHWFVLRILSRWIPYPSLSVGTPWLSFHIGSKGIAPMPLGNDRTWCTEKEEELAAMYEPTNRFHAIALSGTLRRNRH